MNHNSFSKDLWVRYESFVGKIRHVCNSYITICICPEKEKSKQTCLIVYPENWEKVSLLKESDK